MTNIDVNEHKSKASAALVITTIAATLLLSSAPINASAQQQGSCQPSYNTACQNMRNQQSNYQDMQRQRANQQHQEYLRRNDHSNGVTQRTGPTGGIRDGGRGAWVGYQWSTQ